MNARVEMFGMQIDSVRMPEAVEQVLDWTAANEPICRYVVTPNADHAVLFQEHAGLRKAYEDASLVLADGMPVVLASRLLGRPLPERVPGSDLVPALFSAARRRGGLKVFFLGAAPGVAQRAAEHVEARWPGIRVVGTYSPPIGFEKNPEEETQILARIQMNRPDVLVVGLGAPKQELWVQANRQRIHAPVALCVGATIDFLAGEKARAPRWMRVAGLEWVHRLASEPRRLAKRYLRDAWLFPQLVWNEWRAV